MIALLTDFGTIDEYVGVVKGVIYSINPDVKIVDLSHEIPAQDVLWAGLIVYKSCKYFPPGTIFLSVVDPGVGSRRDIIILKAAGYYFIAPDNGLLSLIYSSFRDKKIIRLNQDKFSLKPTSCTFHGRDIFACAAGYLSRNKKLSGFGTEVKSINIRKFPEPLFKKKEVQAEVVHIDRFGNLITNLEQEVFFKLNWANVEIVVKNKSIRGISSCYQGNRGLVAVWDSRNLLEIAFPNGNAARVLKAKKRDIIKLIRN